MSDPWNDKGTLGAVYAYSEWLDSQGLVRSESAVDKRSHAELAAEFLASIDGAS